MGKYDDLRTNAKTQGTANKGSKYDDLRNPQKYVSQKKEQDKERSDALLTDTLNGVMNNTPKKTENKTIDFKAEVAKSKEPQKVDKLQGKLPASSLLNGDNSKPLQTNLQGKLPSSSLVTSTGGGPANADKLNDKTVWDHIDDFNAFSDRMKSSATFGLTKLVDQAYTKVGTEESKKAMQEKIDRADNAKGGLVADVAGSLVSGKAAYDAAGHLVAPLVKNAPKLAQRIATGIASGAAWEAPKQIGEEVGERFGGEKQSLAQRGKNIAISAGMGGLADGFVGLGGAVSKGIKNQLASKIVGGTIGVGGIGATMGTAKEVQEAMSGQQQSLSGRIKDVGKYAAIGAGLGILGGSASAQLMRKNGLSEAEIAEIHSEPLALPEANPRTVRKQLAGEIKTTSNSDLISTPYTFKLGEATPETQAASANRQGSNRSPVKVIDPVADTKYQQSVINEYKRLKTDPSVNLSYKETYDLAVKNMESQKAPNPIVETKLKDTRINGETSYKEPVIRNPKELTREQEVNNRVLAGGELSQEDIDFLLSPEYNPKNLYPESAPTESTYTKPKTEVKTQVKPSVQDEVAATVETDLKPVIKTKVKAESKPVIKSESLVTEVKKPVATMPKKVTPGTRSNYRTIEESGNVSPTLKGKLENSTNKTYTVFKDVEANRLANENIKNLDTAESRFMNNKYQGKESIATGYRVSQELDRLANATKDPDLKEALFGRALAALDKVTADLTRAGQESQAGSLIKRMSPEGQLQNLIRKAKANDLEVKVADSVAFKEEATKYIEADGAGMRENDLSDSFDRLSKGTATKEDMLKIERLMDTARGKIGGKKAPVKDRLPKELNDVRKRDKVVSFLDEAVADAEKRIKKRRGNLNSLPVAEWTDYSIIAASKVAKGIIKAETHIEDLVKMFGEEIRPVATQIFEKAQQLVTGVTKSTLEGDLLKANDAFKRITGQVKATKQERLVEKYIMENPVAEKDVESLRKLSKSLTELQGTDKIKADMAMQKILNSYEKSSPNDKINAVRYISMLLNDATQTINALSGPLMASYGSTIDVLGTMVDVAMSATLKTPRTTTLYGTNPIRFVADWMKYGKIGAKAGYEGVNPAGIQGTNEVRGLAFKSKLNPLGQAERILGAVAKGADYATYQTVYQSELSKQGFLDALENGIKRSDKAAIKQHVRKFVNDPPIEAMEQADRIGKNTTFQRSDSLGGKTANWINSSPKAVKPVVNAVVPFVRTPLNITSTAVTATPAGIIKGLFQLSSMSQASQREAIRTLSMGLGGVGMTSLGFYLSKVGIITGANDTGNKDVNSINEQAGRAKFRFNTSAAKRYTWAMLRGEGADAAEAAAKYQKGDHQFDYNKLQPLAFPLAMGAGYQNKKGNVGNKILGAGAESYGSLFGMSSLKGVQDVFQPQYTGTQGDKAVGTFTRIVESYLKSFSPSMLAQETRRLDPVQRQTAYNSGIKADITDYYKSRLPVLSKTLPAKKDTLGNTKVYPEGVVGQHLNPYKSEVANYSTAAALIADLIDRTGDQSIAPSAPAKNVTRDHVTVTIPQKRYEKLQQDIGSEITRRIIEIEGGTDEEMIDQIKEIYADVRDEYMDEVKDELLD